jgi:hypothetical protein
MMRFPRVVPDAAPGLRVFVPAKGPIELSRSWEAKATNPSGFLGETIRRAGGGVPSNQTRMRQGAGWGSTSTDDRSGRNARPLGLAHLFLTIFQQARRVWQTR